MSRARGANQIEWWRLNSGRREPGDAWSVQDALPFAAFLVIAGFAAFSILDLLTSP